MSIHVCYCTNIRYIARFRHLWALAWKKYTLFYIITWTYRNFAVVGSYTIWLELKNRFVLNNAKKCWNNSTITLLLETKRGYIRISPKIKSNSLFGCEWAERNKICSFTQCCQANYCLLLRLYWTCGNRSFRGSKHRKYWLVYNNLYARINRKCRIIFHHDNTSCNSAHETIDFLYSKNIKLMTHCSSCSKTSNIKYAVNDLWRLKQLLKHSEHCFLRL